MSVIDVRHKEDSWGKIILLKCDVCLCSFEVRYQKHVIERDFHSCSRKCKNTSLKEGGYLHKKTQETCEKKYGVSCVFQSEEIKSRITNTFLEKYGVVNPGQVTTIREKVKNTVRSRYGKDSVLSLPTVRLKSKKTNLKKYGFENPTQSSEVKEKVKQTNIQKYGYAYSFQNEEIRKHAQECMLRRHGSKHGWQVPRLRAKMLESQIKNGTFVTSKTELQFFELLKFAFGEENVIHGKRVNKWPIDFYVTNTNVHYQFDGDYWHGLDRDRTTLESSTNRRDKAILGKMKNDLEQNEWFSLNGFRLVRVSESSYHSFLRGDLSILSLLTGYVSINMDVKITPSLLTS